MSAPRPWTVLSNGPLESLEPNLRVVEGRLPRGHIPRRMTVARLRDGGLVFHNAVPLAEPEMQALESWGTPAILFVPTAWHRLDIHAFKQRYPTMKVLCPSSARDQVAKVLAVDGSIEDFPADPDVQLIALRGTQSREGVLLVKSGGRTSLCFGDMLMNLVALPGLDGLVFRLIGSIGGPRVTPLAQWLLVKDKAALRAHLEELAALPGLARLIPTHGAIVDQDAAGVLHQVSGRLR
jgi:hypothetical protein